jgi:hypothetical protein
MASLEESSEGMLLTKKQFKELEKRVLRRYHDLGEREYTLETIKEIFDGTGIDNAIIQEEFSRIKQPALRHTSTLPRSKNNITPQEIENMKEYQIGYEFKSPETNDLCKVIGYKEWRRLFTRCCGKGMIEISPLVEDQRNGKRYAIGKTVLYCSVCGSNRDDTHGWL